MHFRSSAEAVTFPLVNELIEKINSQNLLIQSERDVEWIFEASFLKNFQWVYGVRIPIMWGRRFEKGRI